MGFSLPFSNRRSKSSKSRGASLKRSSKKGKQRGSKKSSWSLSSSRRSRKKKPTRAGRVVDLRRVVRDDHRKTALRRKKASSRRRPGSAVPPRTLRGSKQSRRSSSSRKRRRVAVPFFMQVMRPFRTVRFKRSILSIVLIFVVLSAAYGLLFSRFFRVEKIILRGSPRMTATELRAAVWPIVERRVIGIPISNIFLVSNEDMEESLRRGNPRLSEISITKKYPSILAFEIVERNLAAVWMTGDQIVFLDASGVVVSEASLDALLEQDLPRLVDLSVRGVSPGQEATLPRHLNYVNQLQEAFDRQLPMQIARYEFPAAKGEEIHVVTAEGVRILFSLDVSIDEQVSKFQVVLREEIKDQYPSLSYVDLRVEDYVYYK